MIENSFLFCTIINAIVRTDIIIIAKAFRVIARIITAIGKINNKILFLIPTRLNTLR